MSILSVNIPEAGYGKKVVIHGIIFNIEQGEIAALIGPNGAGKSTLLKVVMGILKSPGSSLLFNGIDIGSDSTEERVRKGICFIPQGNRIFTELSVLENLEVGGYLINDKNKLKSKIDFALELFPDLKERLKQNAGKLSGGEKQRLALARAVILEPKILLLDEPSLGLSPRLVGVAFNMIKKLKDELNMTVIIVEQKVREVLSISDKVFALRMGEIIFRGMPSELENGTKLQKIFLL